MSLVYEFLTFPYPPATTSLMPIDTPVLLEELLENHGYAPTMSGSSIVIPIGGSDAPYTASFTFDNKGHIRITCQLAVLGDFREDKLGELSLAALDANTQISPYAFAVIGASEGDVDIRRCPLVLTDSLLCADLSAEEVTFSLDKLLEALTFSRHILKLGLSRPAAA
jgi:hypothetical protein